MSDAHTLTVDQFDWQLTLAYGATATVADAINGTTQKSTPVAADRFPLTDSAASFALKYATLQNILDVQASATQTFTNKTITSPTVTGATITTSTLTSPTINGAKNPTTSVTATSYTQLVTDNMILVDDDTAGADVTITLAAAATAGDGYEVTIKKLGTTGNVIVDGSGAETIDGATTSTLTAQYESLTIKTNGTSWFIK